MIFPIRTDNPLRQKPYVNYGLIALNVLIFLAQQVDATTFQIFYLNPLSPGLFNYFSYAFLHAGFAHLLGNMVFLYIFGNSVCVRMGQVGYLAFYLAGGVIAGCAHVLISDSPVLGASGAVAAVTGAFLILYPLTRVTIVYFFIIIGVAHVASYWIILAYFALDVIKQFSTGFFGTGATVAYMAHIGGTLFGVAVATALLSTRLVPNNPYDALALVRRWRVRRQYRRAVAGGYNFFETAQPAEKPAKVNPQQERAMELRASAAEAIAHDKLDEAVRFYLALREVDATQVLSRQNQLDVANHLFALSRHDAAAAAYDAFLERYPQADDINQVRLMAGLIHARYTNDTAKAQTYLSKAVEGLHEGREVELARNELARLRDAAQKP
ncbi:MAG: rhomboid family intramembrane serine protease [Phycisphaerae bacterium]